MLLSGDVDTMQSGMQYYQQHRPARKQSPALETPLPEFIPPQGQRGQDIMIIWDFQNVRTPTELEPVEIIRWVRFPCTFAVD